MGRNAFLLFNAVFLAFTAEILAHFLLFRCKMNWELVFLLQISIVFSLVTGLTVFSLQIKVCSWV